MGWRNFFSSCAVVSVFWLWREIVFVVTFVLRVQYSCGVVMVLWLRQEIVFGDTYYTYLEYNVVVRLCQFLVVTGNSSQNENHFWLPMSSFYKKILLGYYYTTLLWSARQCVYFVRPNTLLLCISLFCIFLLYLTDPQTHSHCVKMWTPAITLWFPIHSF